MSWLCNYCDTKIGDSFEQCWNCQTRKEEDHPPQDRLTHDDIKNDPDPGEPDLKKAFSDRFICSKCEYEQAKIGRVTDTGGGVSAVFEVETQEFIIVSCKKCGHTDFYNIGVILDENRLSPVLDLLFG